MSAILMREGLRPSDEAYQASLKRGEIAHSERNTRFITALENGANPTDLLREWKAEYKQRKKELKSEGYSWLRRGHILESEGLTHWPSNLNLIVKTVYPYAAFAAYVVTGFLLYGFAEEGAKITLTEAALTFTGSSLVFTGIILHDCYYNYRWDKVTAKLLGYNLLNQTID